MFISTVVWSLCLLKETQKWGWSRFLINVCGLKSTREAKREFVWMIKSCRSWIIIQIDTARCFFVGFSLSKLRSACNVQRETMHRQTCENEERKSWKRIKINSGRQFAVEETFSYAEKLLSFGVCAWAGSHHGLIDRHLLRSYKIFLSQASRCFGFDFASFRSVYFKYNTIQGSFVG